jgi:hypothetical protein
MYLHVKYPAADIITNATGYRGIREWNRNNETGPSNKGVASNATGDQRAKEQMRLNADHLNV